MNVNRKLWKMDRRTMLKGMGAAMALPMLESMVGSGVGSGMRSASASLAKSAANSVANSGNPATRAAFIFFPNGVNPATWQLPKPEVSANSPAPSDRPKKGDLIGERSLNELDTFSDSLSPLMDVRDDLSVMSGLTLHKARANGDGPGDHARASASFLTGEQAYKTSGSNIRIGVSVDQVAAREMNAATPLSSLELGCDRGTLTGNCDSGYACAYVSNISWRDERTPMLKEIDPAQVFARLFGSKDQAMAKEAQERLMSRRQSILDFVAEDARQLEKQLGAQDRLKLHAYQESVRDIENRIQRATQEHEDIDLPDLGDPGYVARPDGIPAEHAAHQRLMYDLMLLAFQTDQTRIATLMLNRAGSNRRYRSIGIREGHHHLSHHQHDDVKIQAIRKIDHFNVQQFAYFVQRLRDTPEVSPDGQAMGSLLDHSMILFGSGINDGNRHDHDDLPIVFAGGKGLGIETGRHLRYAKNTPLCNLYLSMLHKLGVQGEAAEQFGDSTGTLIGV